MTDGVNSVEVISPGIIDIGNYGYEDDTTEPCTWIVKCWERHLRDLERQNTSDFPYYFSDEHGKKAIQFFNMLRQSKGEWAGKVLKLTKWQKMILWIVHGWRRAESDQFDESTWHTRRFRRAWCEVPRKSGKSTFSSGNAIQLLFDDPAEPGAEIYNVATKNSQARIVFSESQRMCRQSKGLLQHLTVLRNNISCLRNGSFIEPLSSDSNKLDGLNVHGATIDEIHAFKGESFRLLHDLILTARGSRRQPLIWYITTAGIYRESIAYELHRRAEQVLDGVIEDETYFAYIATINEGQDWRSEEAWKTANPSYGITQKRDNFVEECEAAIQTPAAQNSFLRLRLNVWTESVTAWITTHQWAACRREGAWPDLTGARCFAGLDLASTIDVAALVLVFPFVEDDIKDGNKLIKSVFVKPFFFIPKENAIDRDKRDGVPYTAWIRDGHIEATSGSAIDYDYIRKRVNQLGEQYDIQEIAIDRWNATQISQQLDDDGFTVVPFGQGYRSMSDPCKQLQALILQKTLFHDGHPTLRWMFANAVIEQDASDNIKISKKESTEKVDGVVATAMAVGRMMLLPDDERKSVYQDRGLTTF